MKPDRSKSPTRPETRKAIPLSLHRVATPSHLISRVGFIGFVATILFVTSTGHAQSNSLLRQQAIPPGVVAEAPIRMEEVSLIKLPPPPTYQLHDLIHIKVTESFINRINAQLNRRRQIQYQYRLQDFIVILEGLRLRRDAAIRSQRPAIDLNTLVKAQNQYQFNRDDILRYSLQAEVVEIRPNGNLLLEANGEISVNNEIYQYRMSGIVSALDIDPQTRTVDSTRVASKRLDLRQLGQARDGLKRGYISAALDWFNPF